MGASFTVSGVLAVKGWLRVKKMHHSTCLNLTSLTTHHHQTTTTRYVDILTDGIDEDDDDSEFIGQQWEAVDSIDSTPAVLPFWPAVIWSALWLPNLLQLLFAGWQVNE